MEAPEQFNSSARQLPERWVRFLEAVRDPDFQLALLEYQQAAMKLHLQCDLRGQPEQRLRALGRYEVITELIAGAVPQFIADTLEVPVEELPAFQSY